MFAESLARFIAGMTNMNTAGGDGAHAHAVQLNVQYVDLLLAKAEAKKHRAETSPARLEV